MSIWRRPLTVVLMEVHSPASSVGGCPCSRACPAQMGNYPGQVFVSQGKDGLAPGVPAYLLDLVMSARPRAAIGAAVPGHGPEN